MPRPVHLLFTALTCVSPAWADSLVAVRTLPAHSIVAPDDVVLVDAEIPGALQDPSAAIGLETQRAIYGGRPLRPEDLASPALVERNALVTLVYRAGTLTILAEGRALARGRAGDLIRVMNLSSKTTVQGQVGPDGLVKVGETQ